VNVSSLFVNIEHNRDQSPKDYFVVLYRILLSHGGNKEQHKMPCIVLFRMRSINHTQYRKTFHVAHLEE
jgi:hemerythrin superfamily protein